MNDKQVITMDNFITRPEHEEFCRRVDAEEKRQNRSWSCWRTTYRR